VFEFVVRDSKKELPAHLGCLSIYDSLPYIQPSTAPMSVLLKVILVFFIIGYSGCAIIDNEDPEEFVEAYYFPSCGPTDGPAIELIIPTQVPLVCDNVLPSLYQQPWPDTFTRIYITRFPMVDQESTLATYYFGIDNDPESNNGSGGWAGRCFAGEDGQSCIEASQGFVQIPNNRDTFFDAGVYIEFEDASIFEQTVRVKACELRRPLLCG